MGAGLEFGPASLAAFILFIGILIFVHELGHFLVAKWAGVRVLKFSLGFGPPLVSFQRGETVYQIAAIPLGGFVKMAGDSPFDDAARNEPGTFTAAPIHRRALIALAGPAFNLAFPVLCFFAYNVIGPMVTPPIVGALEIGQPADRAGLVSGDRIVAVDGERVWSFSRLSDLINARPGKNTDLTVLRDGVTLHFEVVPDAVPQDDDFGGREIRGMIRVSPEQIGTRVGVDRAELARGFETGDRIVRIDGKDVSVGMELDPRIRDARGKRIEIVVERLEALEAGDLLRANAKRHVPLSVTVPTDASGLESLGLAPSDTFVRSVLPGSAAARAGLEIGDRILEVNGRRIRLFWSILQELRNAESHPVKLLVRRDGREREIELVNDRVPCMHEMTGKESTTFDAGFGRDALPKDAACRDFESRAFATGFWFSRAPRMSEKAALGLQEALLASVGQTLDVAEQVLVVLYKLLTGEISEKNVGGVVMIYHVAARAAELGPMAFLSMLAFISVNIGIINLLPVPIFDGGHLLFCFIEAVKREPVSKRVREAASIAGFVLVLALLLLAFRNDIVNFKLFG